MPAAINQLNKKASVSRRTNAVFSPTNVYIKKKAYRRVKARQAKLFEIEEEINDDLTIREDRRTIFMIGKRERYLGKEPAGGGGWAAGSCAVSPDDGEHVPQADTHRQVTLLHRRHQTVWVHQHSAPQPKKV